LFSKAFRKIRKDLSGIQKKGRYRIPACAGMLTGNKKRNPFSEVLFSEAVLAFCKVHKDDTPEEMLLLEISRGKAGGCILFS
jgi:hypothetical protein